MRSKLSIIVDFIFIVFSLFGLFLFILNFFVKYPFSLIIALFLSAFLSVWVLYFLNKKNKNGQIKLGEKKEYDATMLTLSLLSKPAQNELFFKCAEKNNNNPQKSKGGIYFKDKKQLIFLHFGFSCSLKAQIIKAFNSLNKNDCAIIYTLEIKEEDKVFASRFNNRIILKDGKELFNFLKSTNTLPTPKLTPSNKKNFFNFSLQKKKANKFLAFGFLLLGFSFFVPIKLYYVVFGCVFLLLSIFCRLFGKQTI